MQREANSEREICSPNGDREEPRAAATALPFAENLRPRRRIDVTTRLIDGELVVLDRDGGLVHQLNRTATYIWERCNGQHTIAEIAGQVHAMFEVDQETALRDVGDSVRRLQRAGLLQA